MKRLSLHLRTILLLIWTRLSVGDGFSCPYGQYCGFEPAPPGRAPTCAQPGLTYCVHPDPYPENIIRQLIEAGQYDIRTLLSDETRDDFGATKKNDYPYDYGPNSLPHVDQISLVDDYNKDYNKFNNNPRYNNVPGIFSQKTPLQLPSQADPSPYNVNYQSANISKLMGFSAPWQENYYEKVLKKGYYDANVYPSYENNEWYRQAPVTRYNANEWWKYVSPSRSDVTVEQSISYPRTMVRKRRRRNASLSRRVPVPLQRQDRVHHSSSGAQQQGQLEVRRQHAGQHDAAGPR